MLGRREADVRAAGAAVTPAEMRAHARVTLAIADVLEALGPDAQPDNLDHGTSTEVPFMLYWAQGNRCRWHVQLSFPLPHHSHSTVSASSEHVFARPDAQPGQGFDGATYRDFSLDDMAGIVAFVRERVGR